MRTRRPAVLGPLLLLSAMTVATVALFGASQTGATPVPGDGKNTIEVAPADSGIVAVGSTFSVEIHLSEAELAYLVVQAQLEWDAAGLERVSDTSSGPFFLFPGSAAVGSDDPPGTEDIYNMGGLVDITPVTTVGLIWTVTLRCDAPGVFPLHLVPFSEDPVWRTATASEPGQSHPMLLEDGQVNCGGVTPGPTSTVTPTRTPAPPTPTATSAPPSLAEEWAVIYDGPAGVNDMATAIVVDGSGSAYVTGKTDEGDSGLRMPPDYATIKYRPDGSEQWIALYDGPASSADRATAVAVDGSGNVYVTGSSYDTTGLPDFATIKYGPDGSEQWVARHDGPASAAAAVAVDGLGNVYVTGSSRSSPTSPGFLTIKYGPDGGEQWLARYASPAGEYDVGRALAVDGSGNVYVAGTSYGNTHTTLDFATIKYGPDGTEQWVARYDGPAGKFDWVESLAVDDLGNVYVAGRSRGISTLFDYAIVKYGPDGSEQWVARYDGPASGDDYLHGLAVDELGNVYVTGWSDGPYGQPGDSATVKYGPDGREEWVARYDGPAGQGAAGFALALDQCGYAYVAGISQRDTYMIQDYATIKYGPDGREEWVARYDGPGEDWARAIAVDQSANVFLTGYSRASINERFDWLTIRYSQPFLGVLTDVEPGSDANVINPKSKGTIAVAILTTEVFDASSVDPQSVRFEGAPAERARMKDADHDGDEDLLLHFKAERTDLAPGQTKTSLRGETFDGEPFEGCDLVRLVPSPNGTRTATQAVTATPLAVSFAADR